jgi:hypothetical protein
MLSLLCQLENVKISSKDFNKNGYMGIVDFFLPLFWLPLMWSDCLVYWTAVFYQRKVGEGNFKKPSWRCDCGPYSLWHVGLFPYLWFSWYVYQPASAMCLGYVFALRGVAWEVKWRITNVKFTVWTRSLAAARHAGMFSYWSCSLAYTYVSLIEPWHSDVFEWRLSWLSRTGAKGENSTAAGEQEE